VKTLEQIRDEVALLLGYTKRPDESPWWDCDTTSCNYHPVPSTIDGIAALWPEGWYTSIDELLNYPCGHELRWRATAKRACKAGETEVLHVSTNGPTEYKTRLRLLHAALAATRSPK